MKDQKSVIHSIRISKSLKEFLNSLDNANEFIKELLLNTDDYKKFLRESHSLIEASASQLKPSNLS